ncbi:alkaline phosphatase DedA family [Candidatus Rickettsiella viridis]|uniref:Alkaline phosphatase DedA family n=1 Tax=Candidatus Rickettsiella viridis TaxID=676208 RepID=A0A2Z5UUJ1_9COXI|nr:DedA family protein [Candidatus Rickettsiella viridis]BBB15158.1 alkaline phosphatase DedA family [Candidatus Rickettsiella viridis]
MQSFLNQFIPWIQHYGSVAVFLWLALGIIALPIPEESLLLFIGFLMAKDKLPIVSTVIAAYAGTCSGITGSYGLGIFTSRYIVRGWGRYIGLTEKRFQRAHNWFERFGKWALCIGYFIPGVRHLTGYVAGALKLCYKHFAIFAYCGGIAWASLFMSLGYFFYKPINAFIGALHAHTVSLLQLF